MEAGIAGGNAIIEPVCHRMPALPVLGVSMVLIHEDRVLLAQRGKEPAKGLWSLPGGKVERGEALRDAAAREVLEETGIATHGHGFREFAELIGADYHFVIAVFMARMPERATPAAGDDALDARWFSKAEMAAMNEARQMTRGTFERICRLADL